MTDTPSRRLAGRLALVTGASRGLGAAIARRFAAEGAHVILAARTVGALEELDDAVQALGGAATLVPLDLLEHDQIDALGAALYQRFGRLDILVGNAGMLGELSPIAHTEPKVWDRVLSLNLSANYRLIRSLDPLLRQSDAGRAIFVTDAAGRNAEPYWSAYAASKAALETVVRMYAGEIALTKVRANLIDPGALRTGLRAQAFPGQDPEDVPPPDAVAGRFVDLAEPDWTLNGALVEI